MLKVRNKYFYKDGRRFFYLADTCWGAFTSMTMVDWKYYLAKRKHEGFNAIQINVLRQYDSTKPLEGHDPFPIVYHEDGSYEYDYSSPNEAYFNNAERMLEEMKKLDMTPTLVLLWGNYIPDSWMNDPNGFQSHAPKPQVMSFAQIKSYVSYVVNRFKRFDPIYLVSGDVGFDKVSGQDPEIETKYYNEVIKAAKVADPEGIYSFHINGKSKTLPPVLEKQADFFSYQSGHGPHGEEAASKIPEAKRKDGYPGPVVNAEPCYEGMTQFGVSPTHRFSAYDVRRTAWKSVLSGADAGIGYGSFGIWPWNDIYRPEQTVVGPLKPYDWRECLQFRGAQDLGFLKDIILNYAQDGLTPLNLQNEEVKVAEGSDYYLIYSPVANPIDLSSLNIKVQSCKIYDLQSLRSINTLVDNNIIPMVPVLEDELVIIEK